ncbi:MAG: Crp/Fnr family transcriptional regulator [Cyanobacteria bacterium]|nr:Crp/Fnr family transcriptional regulator [Cyanobacteria bacterium CG_2015-16_32_12]NCO78670.1 Crp/Fnr family transcriptional regulator [Cyanobacteria bacterium CG_2015-22_32_23]NCQ05889.1 Crp/Fnr family transcriptional regulator [Cyanobacteria bacterium CG_2015-09_32_10]NCQ42989.1 Crp/Fnr family transcriptional regulator [Cyanobacteria bacterium CG_2015-04_32_10]
METQEISDLFPLFHNLNTETIEWLVSMADSDNYESEEVIIAEDDWGKAIYFIVSGWVKLENIYSEENVTLEIIGKGGCVGEAGILSTLNGNSRVIAISAVEVLSISAQRFLQILFRDSQIQNRFLKLMVSRVTEYQKYCQFHRQTGKVRLATVLISLADKYGEITEKGIKLYPFLRQDLADLAQLTLEECSQIMNKLEEKKVIYLKSNNDIFYIFNIKQLHHIIGKLGNE